MNQPTKPDNADFARFSPCCSGGVAAMMSNPKGSYVLLKDALAGRVHRPAVAGSVDTPEFRQLVAEWANIDLDEEGITSGTKLLDAAWTNLIAHINALIAQAAPRGEAVLYARLIDMERNDERGVLAYRDAEEDWCVPLYPHPAPRDVDAPIVLPEKPHPKVKGDVPKPWEYFAGDQMDAHATAAVQNDRASKGQTK